MSDKDELVEFPQHTMIDTDLAETPYEADAHLADGPTKAVSPVADSSEAEPAPTVLIQSPFVETSPAEEVPKARLVVSFGNDRGKEFVLPRDTIVVGRSLEAGIVLNDPTVSRKHFEVHFRGGRWVLRDLGSGNGTRVGGEKVSEIELAEGMQIEVGQTLLTFTCDEAKTRAIEVPVAPPRPLPPEPKPAREVTVQPAPVIRVESEAVPEERRGPSPWLLLGGAVVLILVGLAVVQFGFGVRLLPIGGEEARQQAAQVDPAALKAEAQDLYQRGMKAFQARNWDQSLALLEQAAEKDSSIDGLQSAMARAKEERRNASLVSAAKTAIEKGRKEDAVQALSKVSDTSTYYNEARTMLATLNDEVILEEIQRVRELLAARKKSEAQDAYLALLSKYPDDERVLRLRDELVKAGIRLEPARKPSTPTVLAGDTKTRPPKSGTGKLDTSRALQLYNGGSFEQASAELRTMAARLRPEEAVLANELARRIDTFASVFNEGKNALAGKRLDKAEQSLSLALRLDGDINGHYRPEISAMLGDTFSKSAAAALQDADYAQAAKRAKRALSYKSDDERARKILEKCMSMAESFYSQAVADVQAGRREAARRKLVTVLDIVPSSHSLYEKASELMQQVK